MWTGSAAEGERWFAAMRAAAPVILDDVADKPYTAIDSVHNDPVDPMPVVDPAILLDDFTAETAERLLARAGHGSGSPQILVELRALGGAYAREGEHPSAFRHRAARFSLLAVGMADSPAMEHAQQMFADLAEWDTGGIWPNFGPAHDEATARRAYDEETLERLAEIVDRYDPDGVLQIGGYTRTTRPSAEAA